MTIDSADDSKISNRTINTNRISNRTMIRNRIESRSFACPYDEAMTDSEMVLGRSDSSDEGFPVPGGSAGLVDTSEQADRSSRCHPDRKRWNQVVRLCRRMEKGNLRRGLLRLRFNLRRKPGAVPCLVLTSIRRRRMHCLVWFSWETSDMLFWTAVWPVTSGTSYLQRSGRQSGPKAFSYL